ncbi:hypothetical protein BVG19_g1862 [[Candida] boidinii]|nr:hypothetical protein BVG19_g1862 [[Candida] boidinii]OWB51454.1 hypothetical protein B5S27_g3015 [[Candida] boidinii]
MFANIIRSTFTRNGLKTIVSNQQTAKFSIKTVLNKERMVMYEPLPPLRSNQKLMDYIKEAQYTKLDKNGLKRKLIDSKNRERLRSDDIVTVVYKNQKPITGMIIAIKKSGLASTILLRNKITGLGVEMHIPIFHPNILRVDIVRRPINYRPRARHYYIRNSRLDVNELDGKK